MTSEPTDAANAELLPLQPITPPTSIPVPANLEEPVQETMNQSKFLAAYVVEGNLSNACLSANITKQTHYYWIRTSESYRKRFQAIANSSLDEARARLDVLLPRAAEVFEEGLEATKSLAVQCPACEHEFHVQIDNQAQRLSVAKDLFKRSGDLVQKLKVEGEVQHRDMALEDRLALAQVQAWEDTGRLSACPVPPDVYDGLKRRGLLGDSGVPGRTVPMSTRIDSAIRSQARSALPEAAPGEWTEVQAQDSAPGSP